MLTLSFATEPLLHGEIAPRWSLHTYTIPAGYCPGRYRCVTLVLFRHRYIIELRKGLDHVRANRSKEVADPT